MPHFEYEKVHWNEGILVAGCDEVGRGAFAGPVVAAAVAFTPNFLVKNLEYKINDSKKLTSKQREESSGWIKSNSLAWGIGEASVSFINKKGIVAATNFAFRSAIRNAQNLGNCRINILLIDAFYIPFVRGIKKDNQKAIIGGDSISFSIAAASIIAKVHRDRLMINLAKRTELQKYGWHKNKGYGTLEHRSIIQKFGVTPHHRKLYVRNI